MFFNILQYYHLYCIFDQNKWSPGQQKRLKNIKPKSYMEVYVIQPFMKTNI